MNEYVTEVFLSHTAITALCDAKTIAYRKIMLSLCLPEGGTLMI